MFVVIYTYDNVNCRACICSVHNHGNIEYARRVFSMDRGCGDEGIMYRELRSAHFWLGIEANHLLDKPRGQTMPRLGLVTYTKHGAMYFDMLLNMLWRDVISKPNFFESNEQLRTTCFWLGAEADSLLDEPHKQPVARVRVVPYTTCFKFI